MTLKECSNTHKIIMAGFIDKGTGPHQSNIVYSIDGLSPCVMAMWSVKQPSAYVVVYDENFSDR